MQPRKDYTKSSFRITGSVILLLFCVALIPPASIHGINLRRANILSDVVDFRDEAPPAPTLESLLDTSYLVGFEFPEPAAAEYPEETYIPRENTPEPSETSEEEYVPAAVAPETAPPAETVSPADQDTPADLGLPTGMDDTAEPEDSTGVARPYEKALRGITRAAVADTTLVPIEDFSRGEEMMNRFYNALVYETPSRTVRIAVFGDSFTESDIITGDIREGLQLAYGGSGVGFMPFSTPLSKFRKTVGHTFSNWNYYNIIQKKGVPEDYRDKFFVSGILSVPQNGAKATYKGTDFRQRTDSAGTATLLFINGGSSRIGIALDGLPPSEYVPAPNDSLIGHIHIGDGRFSQLEVTIAEPEGFIGYGVVLEDSTGVSVHNYSVRSNSGLALFGTDASVNRQIGSLMGYDLIILQYGLNVMSSDIFDYGYYRRHLTRLIEYVRQCFPGAAILVMSIGDRSTLKSGTAVTMPEVRAMLETQRQAAVEGEVAFWNTLEGMGGEDSMPLFVRNKWASKDHTHINYLGGKQIADQLVAYIKAAAESIREQDEQSRIEHEAERERMMRGSGVAFADSLARAMFDAAQKVSEEEAGNQEETGGKVTGSDGEVTGSEAGGEDARGDKSAANSETGGDEAVTGRNGGAQ